MLSSQGRTLALFHLMKPLLFIHSIAFTCRYIFPNKEINKIDDELRVGVKFDDIYGMFEAKK